MKKLALALATAENTIKFKGQSKKFRRNLVALMLAVLLTSASLLIYPLINAAATAPSLGAAQSFGVLAGTTVTNTGSSVVTGDVGVSPGNSITG